MTALRNLADRLLERGRLAEGISAVKRSAKRWLFGWRPHSARCQVEATATVRAPVF